MSGTTSNHLPSTQHWVLLEGEPPEDAIHKTVHTKYGPATLYLANRIMTTSGEPPCMSFNYELVRFSELPVVKV